MNGKFQATALLTLALVCAYFPAESIFNPPRCFCLNFIQMVPYRIVEDFLIIPKEPHCATTQIILVVNVNNSKMEVCLHPSSKQGRTLIGCWERIGHDLERKSECIRRKRKTKN